MMTKKEDIGKNLRISVRCCTN